MTKTVKLSEYASMNSVTWRTAFRWFQEGKIDGARKTPGGSIVVDIDDRGDARSFSFQFFDDFEKSLGL